LQRGPMGLVIMWKLVDSIALDLCAQGIASLAPSWDSHKKSLQILCSDQVRRSGFSKGGSSGWVLAYRRDERTGGMDAERGR
jgi:hypothetical protein